MSCVLGSERGYRVQAVCPGNEGCLKLQRGDWMWAKAAMFHSSQATEATRGSALLKWPWGS